MPLLAASVWSKLLCSSAQNTGWTTSVRSCTGDRLSLYHWQHVLNTQTGARRHLVDMYCWLPISNAALIKTHMVRFFSLLCGSVRRNKALPLVIITFCSVHMWNIAASVQGPTETMTMDTTWLRLTHSVFRALDQIRRNPTQLQTPSLRESRGGIPLMGQAAGCGVHRAHSIKFTFRRKNTLTHTRCISIRLWAVKKNNLVLQ